MSFLIRSVEEKDLSQLMSLAKQFSLLNMPPDENTLKEKIARSLKSFTGKGKKEDAEYVFVLEDTEVSRIIGCSLILAKHGTRKSPHTYFKVLKKEKYSEELGMGFIHQILRFRQDTDGPTEIGGLLIDRAYRRRPEKLGRQISLVRFIYAGLYPERFEKRVLCELTPPLTEEGRSEFWESLGRRFTGLPYQEADRISQNNKEFIKSLFPEDDIYMTLLDSRARLVLGRVGEATMPAKHLLESIGFKYLDEVDPFDGGPHFGADFSEITIIKNGSKRKLVTQEKSNFNKFGLVGSSRNSKFVACQTIYDLTDTGIVLPKATKDLLSLADGDEVFWSPLNY